MNVAYSELDVTVLTSLSNLIGVGNPKSSVVPSKIILSPASVPDASVPSKRITPPSCAVTTVSGVFCNNLNPASVCDESVPSNNNSPSFSKIISSGSSPLLILSESSASVILSGLKISSNDIVPISSKVSVVSLSSSSNNILSFSFCINPTGTAILSFSCNSLPVPGLESSNVRTPVSSSSVMNTISSNGIVPSNTICSLMLPVPDSNTKLQASLNGYSAKCNNKLSLTLDGGLLLILIVLSCIAVL